MSAAGFGGCGVHARPLGAVTVCFCQILQEVLTNQEVLANQQELIERQNFLPTRTN
jgi:hypothetical protein